MSRNYYAEINLHVTWHTKKCSPMLEIANAVSRTFCLSSEAGTRRSVVHQGIGHALGVGFLSDGPAVAIAAVNAFVCSAEGTIEFLMRVGAKRDQIARSLAGESAAIKVFEQARSFAAGLDIDHRRKIEFGELFSRNGLDGPVLSSTICQKGNC